jgi:hypothetical protein
VLTSCFWYCKYSLRPSENVEERTLFVVSVPLLPRERYRKDSVAMEKKRDDGSLASYTTFRFTSNPYVTLGPLDDF